MMDKEAAKEFASRWLPAWTGKNPKSWHHTTRMIVLYGCGNSRWREG